MNLPDQRGADAPGQANGGASTPPVRRVSLRTKFLMLSALVQALLVMLMIWNNQRVLDEAIGKNTQRLAREYAATLNFSLTPYSSSGRLAELQLYLDEMLSDPKDSVARYIAVRDARGQMLVRAGELPAELLSARAPTIALLRGLQIDGNGALIRVSSPLLLTEHQVGVLYFGLSTQELSGAKSDLLRQGALLGLIGLGMASLLFYLITLGMGRRLTALTHQSMRLAQGRLGDVLPERGGDEIEVYTRSLNTMSVALFEQVNELKRSQHSLAESQLRFQTLFELTPVAISLTDPHGVLQDANVAMLTMLGQTRAQILGRTSAEFNFWGSPAERERIWGAWRAKGVLRGDIAVATLPDGRQIELAIWASMLSVAGGQSVIWVLLDISAEFAAKRALGALNASLETRVRQRSAELEHSNAELSAALETLKQTQTDLIRSGKLASLGSMVAGVAHELNTPIGNSVTVASVLHANAQSTLAELRSARPNRAALDETLQASLNASEILMRNLYRATEMVASFKQVAVDQASSQRRQFDLRHTLEDVIVTLEPMYKKTPFRLHTELVAGVTMDSYPGPLGQIVTNFISNAVNHAFEGRSEGRMTLSTRLLDAEHVELRFCDDGIGIAPQHQARVFDPFFTTKLGRGGSGLGMHIVYNLVTGVLGGKITLVSSAAHGTELTVILPLRAAVLTADSPAGNFA